MTSFLFVFQEKANKEMSDSDKLFGALMKHVRDAQCKLQQNIEDKLRKSQDRDKAMIEELQEEITQLQRTHSELDELSESDDHLHILQVARLFCDPVSLRMHLFVKLPQLQMRCKGALMSPKEFEGHEGKKYIQYKRENVFVHLFRLCRRFPC